MNFLPVNAIVLFVGGPNNGFIEVGDKAMFYAMDLDLPREGEAKPGRASAIEGARSKIGRRVRPMPKYAQDVPGTIGMEKAVGLWEKYGTGPMPTPVYELIQIDLGRGDGDVFIYDYIGEYSEVYPEEK